jgi:hypothetical protein
MLLMMFLLERIDLPRLIPFLAGVFGITLCGVGVWKWVGGFQATEQSNRKIANQTLRLVVLSLFLLASVSFILLFLKMFPNIQASEEFINVRKEARDLRTKSDDLRDDIQRLRQRLDAANVAGQERDAKIITLVQERDSARLGEQDAKNSLTQLVMLINNGNTNIPIMENLEKLMSSVTSNTEAIKEAVIRSEMEKPRLALLIDGTVVTNLPHVVFLGNPPRPIAIGTQNIGKFAVQGATVYLHVHADKTNIVAGKFSTDDAFAMRFVDGVLRKNDSVSVYKVVDRGSVAVGDVFGMFDFALTNAPPVTRVSARLHASGSETGRFDLFLISADDPRQR